MALTKSEILADEGKFQDACSRYVAHNVDFCVSSLMFDVGQNLEECSRIFDFDYDEAVGWFQRDDWQEPVEELIANADLETLEAIAEKVGWWSDVLIEAGVPEVEAIIFPAETSESEEDEDAWRFIDAKGTPWIFDDEDDAIEAARMSVIDKIREVVSALITNDDEYRDIANEFSLDPYTYEVYEHWVVDRYFATRELATRGHVVFEFGGMTIWGRPTTGQSISLDGVIRDIVRGLDEHHWVWGEVR